ncbi:amidase [Occallatibacter savannae]|uniref:amidase n=1 Tax=Occallatibacter savannae TaxID=1002691 RepID=UPI0013A58EB3|nr:amidase [Occallatibacter savannae]
MPHRTVHAWRETNAGWSGSRTYNPVMEFPPTIREARALLAAGATTPGLIAEAALARANGNAGKNTYLWRDPQWTTKEAANASALAATPLGLFGDGRSNLWGIPVSVKDLFDLAGTPTSCGVELYRVSNGAAANDSWLVERLRRSGAVITGKTHLHPLAFGITGENPDFGDCVQPGDADALTGGSSSGAAASVLEGSALAAIGTDTGGSIRLPAALCSLVGYRASIGRGDWRGGAHLSQTFDTMGWLFRDLEDAPLLAETFAQSEPPEIREYTRFAVVDEGFLDDCDPAVAENLRSVTAELQALGLRSSKIDVSWWRPSFEIYAAIQAREAAEIHAGNYAHFPPAIRERLEWGAGINDAELRVRREQHEEFSARIDALLGEHQLLLLPASPVARLTAGGDHSRARKQILRYTTPFSLGGYPVVTIPCTVGGMQLAASREEDESLLKLAARVGAQRAAAF